MKIICQLIRKKPYKNQIVKKMKKGKLFYYKNLTIGI